MGPYRECQFGFLSKSPSFTVGCRMIVSKSVVSEVFSLSKDFKNIGN